MLDVLASSPLLTLFAAIALGTLVGAIPFGPVRFGPAGALFVGLAIGALDPRLGEGLALVQSIGLALFVYTIGIAAGASFFRDLKKQTPIMVASLALTAVMAGLVALAGHLTGLDPLLQGGLFAGAFTTTPALAAATQAADGSTTPAVGYAIAYPIGVVVTMLVITAVSRVELPARRDSQRVPAGDLVTMSAVVTTPMRVDQIPGIASRPGYADGEVRASYVLRNGEMSVAGPRERLGAGDQVLILGLPAAVHRAVDALGHQAERELEHDRSQVNHRRFLVSEPAIAGHTVAELNIPARFGAIITRVRRGDTDMLAHSDMVLQLGDRVRVVYPRGESAGIRALFGDSEKRVTEVDFFSVGVGIALGVAAGLITLPLGGFVLALGSAAGPLLVGLVLGSLERTGPIVWTLPHSANLTIRQCGLVLFLAAVGLSSGQAFASTAFTATGATIALIAVAVLALTLPLFWLLGRLVGLSTARTAGALAGFVGQPVLLNHASTLIEDDRVEPGYSATFAIGIIAKIVLVQLVMAV